MSKHRNPRPKVPKRPTPDNPDPGLMLERLYGDLVELEGIAVTADECVTALPVFPTGKYKRTLRRLYVLVGATAGRASKVLERNAERGHARPACGASRRQTLTEALSRCLHVPDDRKVTRPPDGRRGR